MRLIAGLKEEQVPRDDEFKFRSRAAVLLNKWHEIVDDTKTTAPETNGTHENGDTTMEVKPETKDIVETTDAPAPAPLTETVPPTDAEPKDVEMET